MRWILAVLAAAVLVLAIFPWLREGRQEREERAAPAIDAAPRGPVPLADSAVPVSDPLADVVVTVIIDVARGAADDRARVEMRQRLERVLAEQGLGDETSRRDAAEIVVRTVVGRAGEAARAGLPFADLKLGAVRVLARDFARELRTRLPAGAKALAHDPNALRATAPEPDVPDGYRKVGWQELSGFEYVEGMDLPARVRELGGARVGVSGYMIVLEEGAEGVREFLLVQSLWDCCFGMPPELHQGIVVRYPGKDLGLESQPIQVLGTLEVGEERDESGYVLSVYRISAERVAVID